MSTPASESRENLLLELEAMPGFVARCLGGLAGEVATVRGPGDVFSPVEQCWHLADLEAEGYGVRIRRLLDEEMPALSDFDGERIAEERQYRRRQLAEGLHAFAAARGMNVALLRSVPEAGWSRRGSQEGVGDITLADLPRMMREHDLAHREQILALVRAR